METNKKRTDEGHAYETKRLIERGHMALHLITSEAHAARVEARKAELEVALAEAKSGNAGMLRDWLGCNQFSDDRSKAHWDKIANDRSKLANSDTVDSSQSSVCSLLPEAASPPTDPDSPVRSWSSLIPHAQTRLQSVAVGLRALTEEEPSVLSCDSAISSIAEQPKAPQLALSPEADAVEFAPPVANENNDNFEASVECEINESFAEPLTNESLEFEDLEELRKLAEVAREPAKSMLRGGARGFTVSIVAHLILVSTLMAITMKLPNVPMGLGFDSSSIETVVESFEVSEPMEPMEITSLDVTPEMPSEASLASAAALPTSSGLTSASVSMSAPAAASTLSSIEASANRASSTNGSGRPNPAKASASFFGAGAAGNSFCYVIDGSESMRGGPWEAAKAELLRSLSALKANHRFYIIFFNQELNAIPMPGQKEPATTPLYATPENLHHAQNWIESLRIARGAPPDDALQHAIEIEPDVIYLLADGATKLDVPAFLRSVNRTKDFISGEQIRVPINAIAFYSVDDGRKLMQQVASENKGQFIYVPDPRQK